MRVAAASAFVALSILGLPHRGAAWTCLELFCPTWQGAIPIGIGDLSDDLEQIASGTTLQEIERARHDWTLFECADIPFEPPTPTDAQVGDPDGVSVIGFVHEGWRHDASAIGITTVDVAPCPSVGGCIVEADTELNGQDFDWVVRRGSLPEVNAYSIVLHELGHYFGLGHSSSSNAAMNASYARGYLTLSEDDAAGACDLYPRDGSPQSCEVVGCPFGSACVDGACEEAFESCLVAMDCARDERCIMGSGACVRQNLAVPGLGEACLTDANCESQECETLPEGRVCTLTCDGLDPYSCPPGFHCNAKLTDACGTGYCVTGTMGTGGFGSACVRATDCSSLFCDRGTCSFPCNPENVDNCPAGRTCHPDADGCGACHSPLPLGAPCFASHQCESEICYARPGHEQGTCATPCFDAEDCPEGLDCEPVGEDDALCLPPPPESGCGCAVVGSGAGGSARAVGALVLVVFSLARVRRRRRWSGRSRRATY